MKPAKLPVRHPRPRYRVGDHVRFTFGVSRLVGRIVEDRGPLGVGGRRLYGINYDRFGEPSYLELPEEEMEPANGAAPR